MNRYAGDSEDIPLPEMPAPPKTNKDKPMAFSPPEYTLAGTSMAAENVIECGQCGGLLKESSAFLHSHWHERMNNLKVSW